MVGTKFKGYSKVTMRIKKDLTSSKTDDARSSFFVLAWDFRGCRTLPFSRGQTMPRFPKNSRCHRVNSFIFQRANPHILSPYPLHSLFRTLSLFSPIIIIALWNLTGRDFPRHFPLIFTSFPRPFPGYSHTLPTHFH